MTERELASIEQQWLVVVPPALDEVFRTNPAETFHAGAFWLFYADYTEILVPAFGIGAESDVRVELTGGALLSTRWSPAEWKRSVVDAACEPMKPLYSALSTRLAGASEAAWEEMLLAHDSVVARVARELTALIRGRWRAVNGPVSPNFVIAMLDERLEPQDHDRLVRASVDPDVLPECEGILWTKPV